VIESSNKLTVKGELPALPPLNSPDATTTTEPPTGPMIDTNEIPDALPTPVTEPIDVSKIRQNKNVVDYSKMEVVPILDSAEIDTRNHVRFSPMPPRDWWADKIGNEFTFPRMHAAYQIAGQWFGGHFEWMGPNQSGYKTLDNLGNGYVGPKPPKGSTIYFFWVDNAAQRRTNVVKSNTPYGG
jgi:hypothetical protein